MGSKRTSGIFLVCALAAAMFAAACGSGAEGKYRDPSGQMNAQFQDGKAYIGFGAYTMNGTYKIQGDKIIASGNFGIMFPSPLVFTINKDGSLDPPENVMMPRMEKVK
jgi:hypothetical protein